MVLMKDFCGLSIQLLKNKACLYTAVRYYSDTPAPWNHLWMPKKYIKEDHDKIAEKYHLHPKEYQPYPEEEYRSLGDYPKLPMIGPAAKDPYYPYDIPVFRKNYHETLHADFETMGEDRFSYGYKYRFNLYWASAIWVLSMAILGGIYCLLEPYKSVHPRLEKQHPKPGVVHYSFEPADL